MYDPWSKITTRNGYACDEVISALQKSIRRGLEEQACMFAYELYISSPQLEEKLWRRLLTISVEDIGMGKMCIRDSLITGEDASRPCSDDH